MIDTRVTVFCEDYPAFAGNSDCVLDERLHFDHVPDAAELAEALKAAGYVVDAGGKHRCPRHADRGLKVQIGRDYQEIAPGVLVRLPGLVPVFSTIEVKRVSTDG